MQALGYIWAAGWLASIFVFYSRVGSPRVRDGWRSHWLELLMRNFGWLVSTVAKAYVWPLVLVAWLVQGRQPSRWRTEMLAHGVPVIRRIGM